MPEFEILLFLLVLGAVLGSFFGVLIERLTQGKAVLVSRSRCSSCQRLIPFWQNIPLVSYPLLKGRCAACNSKIPLWVWLIEIVTPTLLIMVYVLYGPSPIFVHAAVLTLFLVPIGLIDLKDWIIPDALTYPGIILGLILGPWLGTMSLKAALLGGMMGSGILLIIRFAYGWLKGREGMGLGDVKLMGMVGVFLGPLALADIILLSALVGLLGSLSGLIGSGRGLKEAVPFGFCIALGTIVYLGSLPFGGMPWGV
jgi:leader peptidase (prepilin peptidase)/N-methyltransferase